MEISFKEKQTIESFETIIPEIEHYGNFRNNSGYLVENGHISTLRHFDIRELSLIKICREYFTSENFVNRIFSDALRRACIERNRIERLNNNASNIDSNNTLQQPRRNRITNNRSTRNRITNNRSTRNRATRINFRILINFYLKDFIKAIQENQLSIPFKKLSKIPESIGNLEKLTSINLDNNKISYLPESFCKLNNLFWLNLHSNQLKILPNSLGNLWKLNSLDLSENKLIKLPDSIGNLKYLRKINLSTNNLIHLPASIGDLESIKKLLLANNRIKFLPISMRNLKNLLYLDLASNKLSNLPEKIFEKGNNIEILFLTKNNLKFLPRSLKNLSNLRILKLAGNKLTDLPSSLSNLKYLKYLHIGYNNFEEFPEVIKDLPSLRYLNISHNKIKKLPEEITNLSKLQVLNINDNNFSDFPPFLKKIPSLCKISYSNNPFRYLSNISLKFLKQMGKFPWEGFDLSKKGAELCKKKDYHSIFKYYQNSLDYLIQKMIFSYEDLTEEEKEFVINEAKFQERQLFENSLPQDNPTLISINKKLMLDANNSDFKMLL